MSAIAKQWSEMDELATSDTERAPAPGFYFPVPVLRAKGTKQSEIDQARVEELEEAERKLTLACEAYLASRADIATVCDAVSRAMRAENVCILAGLLKKGTDR